MTRRFQWIGILPSMALVCVMGVSGFYGCGPDTTDPTTTDEPDVSDDGGLPLCPEGKVDDGHGACRLPGEDSGVPDDTCPDQGTDTSQDVEVPPADEGTPEECPPPSIPNGTYCDLGCTIYWDNSSGSCLSDCSGMFGNPITPAQMSITCNLGDPT